MPNWRANRPVSACIWSRPVKKANLRGSLARIFASRVARISNARSHEIGSNSPAPRSLPGLRSSGCVRRAGDSCFMIPAAPLAQITPLLIGWFGLPSM